VLTFINSDRFNGPSHVGSDIALLGERLPSCGKNILPLKAVFSFEILETTCSTTQHHISQDWTPEL